MIKLFQFPSVGNVPNMGPFCMKLESYLRAVEIPYKIVDTFDSRQSPTGKIPYIEVDGELVADSGLIISKLEAQLSTPMQSVLSTTDKAISLAFIRLIEEHLYWAIVYSRWIDQKGAAIWANQLQEAMGFSKLSFKLISSGIRKNIEKNLQAHGIGRHDQVTIYSLAQDDVKSMADFLGGRDFYFGNSPTLVDHCSYAFICSIINAPWDYSLKEFTLKCQNLIDHYNRMMRFFYKNFVVSDHLTKKNSEVNL